MIQRHTTPQLVTHTRDISCSDNDFEQPTPPTLLIVYTENLKKLQTDLYHRYIVGLPAEHQRQVMRYKFWQDAQRCLFGKLLLEHGLHAIGLNGLPLQNIKYTKYQRPYFEYESIDFNISHSGTLVVCAISTNVRIGIDIEEIRPVETSEFRSLFSESEMNSIGSGADGYGAFYDLWTKKEAVMKANGKGFSIHSRDITIDNDEATVEGQQWFLTKVNFSNNYRCHLSTNIKPHSPIPIKKYTF